MAPLLRALNSGVRSACLARAVSNTTRSHGVTATELLPRGARKEEDDEVNTFQQNPNFHGFSTDPFVDEWNLRLTFFFGFSLAIVIGGTFCHYLPDQKKWARREAERLIKEREAAGVPVMDKNYYDPSKIILPSSSDE